MDDGRMDGWTHKMLDDRQIDSSMQADRQTCI